MSYVKAKEFSGLTPTELFINGPLVFLEIVLMLIDRVRVALIVRMHWSVETAAIELPSKMLVRVPGLYATSQNLSMGSEPAGLVACFARNRLVLLRNEVPCLRITRDLSIKYESWRTS